MGSSVRRREPLEFSCCISTTRCVMLPTTCALAHFLILAAWKHVKSPQRDCRTFATLLGSLQLSPTQDNPSIPTLEIISGKWMRTPAIRSSLVVGMGRITAKLCYIVVDINFGKCSRRSGCYIFPVSFSLLVSSIPASVASVMHRTSRPMHVEYIWGRGGHSSRNGHQSRSSLPFHVYL